MNSIKTLIFSSFMSIVVISGWSFARDSAVIVESESDDVSLPVLIHSVRPEPVWYAPGRTIEGFVTLELKVGTQGVVESVQVLYRTSPLAVKSAVRAIEQWKFKPAKLDGEPVTAWVVYSLPFGNNLQIFANDNYTHYILDPSNDQQIAIR